MGQRTQIILQRVNKQGEKSTQVYFMQWGIGRMMFLHLISLAQADFFRKSWGESADFFKAMQLNHLEDTELLDLNEHYGGEDLTKIRELLDNCDFDNPKEGAGVVFGKEFANNNGGVFVRATEYENEIKMSKTRLEYAFMLGYEEGGEYDRWCSADEYAASNRHCDEQFMAGFHGLMNHFGAIDKGAAK